MKRKIADWLYKFWYNNHTHYWIVFTPEQDKEKCMMCNQLRKTIEWREETIKKEKTFKSEQ
jgi:Pyruvate/2-oxoacid:ferredoxin oxidoreductase delta subunit